MQITTPACVRLTKTSTAGKGLARQAFRPEYDSLLSTDELGVAPYVSNPSTMKVKTDALLTS